VSEKQIPRIFTVLPDEIRNGHPHGQWVFDRPGLVLNFATEIDEETNMPIIEPWAKRLAEFIAGDEPYLVFDSPHTPNEVYLHRAAAEHIIATQPAWSAKVAVRNRPQAPVEYRDSETGVPLVLKRRGHDLLDAVASTDPRRGKITHSD